jgi:LmbE family N-acetylglucosaminyl deacetylase
MVGQKLSWIRALSPEALGSPDGPRIALVAAHPDAEAAASGSLIPSMTRGWLIHVTDGAPRDLVDAYANGLITRAQYGTARHREARAALEVAAFPEERLITMGLVDQEASLDLAGLARAVCVLVTRLSPDAVLSHPYEGGHPDYDATSFAVHAGMALLQRSLSRDGLSAPEILEMACYHAGDGGRVERGRFLTPSKDEIVRPLEGADLERKRAMIACFRTRRRILDLFEPSVERYRAAPCYDFTAPPHDGPLLYERYPWGMEGERFRHLAREALATLDLEGAL